MNAICAKRRVCFWRQTDICRSARSTPCCVRWRLGLLADETRLGITHHVKPCLSVSFCGHGRPCVRRCTVGINERRKRVDVPVELAAGGLDINLCGQVTTGLSRVLAGRRGALTRPRVTGSLLASSTSQRHDQGR